jgi:methyl-accepting chemotaxis protein
MAQIYRSFLKGNMLRLFIFLFLLHPLLYFLSTSIALGFHATFDLLQIIILLAIPIIIFFTVLFILQQKKLYKNLTDIDKNITSIDAFPRRGMTLLVIGCIIGPICMVVVGFYLDILMSWYQSLFFLLTGTILALCNGSLFYYITRSWLHDKCDHHQYHSLTIFQKLMIPIIGSAIVVILFSSSLIYTYIYSRVTLLYSTKISAEVQGKAQELGAYLHRPVIQIQTFSTIDTVESMDMKKIEKFITRAHSHKLSNIELFVVADRTGKCVTSIGKYANIKDRDYFKKAISTGQPAFSDVIINKQTQKKIIVCALPVKRKNRTVGVIAASILLDEIAEMLNNQTISNSGRMFLLTPEGKCIYHPNPDLVGKIFGKDIVDNGTSRINVGRIITSPLHEFFEYRFNDQVAYSYKSDIPFAEAHILYSMDKKEFIDRVDPVLFKMTMGMVTLCIVLFMIIYFIARRLSRPIQNTITFIGHLTEGDLTVQNSARLNDELGDMLSSFEKFRIKLKDIIDQAQGASAQLSSSSEELAATSQNLSLNSQTQAASVEEASASLEEVSGSIELINDNARQQADLARETYGAMEDLMSDNKTVVQYAAQALEVARNTTEQARIGNSLMENTITGMNSIDASTKKIADMVQIISDISDQVNLLALNASIEAARAGEHGRGFAVVADEISKLADETANSAREITDLVQSGLSQVKSGREFVDETGRALETIIGNIASTEKLVQQISQSTEKQAASSETVLKDTRLVMEMAESISKATAEQMDTNSEMGKTVETINQSTQAAAAAAEEIASSAEEISAQAESLQSQIEFFTVDSGRMDN